MLNIFKPILAGATLPDRLIASLGAAIAIALTIVVCAGLPLSAVDLPIIVAPLGASAVLVFAVPSSPLAQPWAVVGGNTISTLIGVWAFNHIAIRTYQPSRRSLAFHELFIHPISMRHWKICMKASISVVKISKCCWHMSNDML